MSLLERKRQELERTLAEIQRLSDKNPQRQRKCIRLKV